MNPTPLSSEDQKAAIKWVADHSEMIECQNPHSAAREGFRAGIRYARAEAEARPGIMAALDNYQKENGQQATRIAELEVENQSFARQAQESNRLLCKVAELEADNAELIKRCLGWENQWQQDTIGLQERNKELEAEVARL